MKINQIIEKLCNHEISKQKATQDILIIINGYRKKNALNFTVEKVYFSISKNYAILKIRLPYEYDKIEGKIKIGDKVDVRLLS